MQNSVGVHQITTSKVGNSGHGKSVKSFKQASTSDEKERAKINGQQRNLDLFSTSPTYSEELCFSEPSVCEFLPCVNHAPLFAYAAHDRTYCVVQGCCNSWNCPRCGRHRAKTEYGRIVQGCRELKQDHELYFITITCKGIGLSVAKAEESYGRWTNSLLDAWRLQAKRTKQTWAYVQVTERQKRGHPHSHIITTFRPPHLAVDWRKKRVSVQGVSFMAYVSAYRSDYVERSIANAGLGGEYDITEVGSVEGASRYVAKYLFKDSIFNTVWPKGWRRVRYSRSFPKLPRTRSEAFVLLKAADWRRLAEVAVIVRPIGDVAANECEFGLRGSDVIIVEK